MKEVVLRGRRAGCPLQRAGVPGIGSGELTSLKGADNIPEEDEYRDEQEDIAERLDLVELGPTHVGRVGVHAPWHAADAHQMHGKERDLEAQKEEPEADLSERFAEHPAGDFREPVRDGREEREHRATNQHVVEVRHHKVGVVKLKIDGNRGDEHAGHAAHDEREEEAQHPPERRFKHDAARG